MFRRATQTLILALALGAGSTAAFAQVDFTRYVALGDSLTAGFWSGGLISTVQVNSYPALLDRQATGSVDDQHVTAKAPAGSGDVDVTVTLSDHGPRLVDVPTEDETAVAADHTRIAAGFGV